MIEEQGQVMAVEGDLVRVAVNRQNACGSCQARAACGQGLVQLLKPGRCHEVLALCEFPVKVGDRVVLGVSESLVLRSALLVYLLPLLALLAGAVVAGQMGVGEGWVVLSSLTMFAAAFAGLHVYNRFLAGQPAMLPQVMRVVPAVCMQETVHWQP